ncbi:hypothetical protein ACFY93_13960 [Streptomyces sp. NPDC008313]|uniref:hypothetical protein n=1 Tax=Streptomyces sp. NPDC008313 TaxID=3364826 RepID=UPI0036E72F3E
MRLDPGKTYRSSIEPGAKLYYRLDLDETASAYVSATAVPPPGATVSSSDGVKVSVQDANGHVCSGEASHFGATRSPHPIAAWAAREAGRDEFLCRDAGTYYAVVERTSAPPSSQDDWDLELGHVSEPPVRKAGSTSPPETWDSASPDPLPGEAKPREGGTGFSAATPLGQGVWRDGIRAGQTLFYAVPVDWGQQVYASAELEGSDGGSGYVGTAFAMALYNPARGFVDDIGSGYDGRQRTAALKPLPPVDFDNRYATGDRVSGMRFAGSYYLVVHLASQVAEKFGDGPLGLTLSVRVSGSAKPGPGYVGQAAPRDAFDVGSATREGTDDGPSAEASTGAGTRSPGSGREEGAERTWEGDDTAMKVVAASGIGTGSALVLLLVAWTAIARGRARKRARTAPESADTATAAPAAVPAEHGGTPRGR